MAIVGALTLSCGATNPRAAAMETETTRRLAARAQVVDGMAAASEDKGDYVRAIAFRQGTVALFEQAYGARSRPVAIALGNLGLAYRLHGDFAKAESVSQRALTMAEEVSGATSLDIVPPANNLARIYLNRGDYANASDILTRVLSIQSKALGWHHPDLAEAELLQGQVFLETNKCPLAVTFYQESLTLFEKSYGPDSQAVAAASDSLARAHVCLAEYEEGEREFHRALAIEEKLRGQDSTDSVGTLTGLGEAYRLHGLLAQAEDALLRAARICLRAGGGETEAAANIGQGLGMLYVEGMHEFARAEPLLLGALAIRERIAPGSPYVVTTLDELAMMYWGEGDLRRAASTLTRALELDEKNIANALNVNVAGPLDWRLAALRGNIQEYLVISLQAQDPEPDSEARRSAMLTLLRRKGRDLDLVGDTSRAMRARLAPTRFDEFLALMRLGAQRRFDELAGYTTVDEQSKRANRDLATQVKRFEDEARGRAAFPTVAETLTVEQVAAAIPSDSALVEIAEYVPIDLRIKGGERGLPLRYAAFVLHPDASVGYADLGEAKTIDAQVALLRAALADPSSNPKAAARDLDERVMRPLRSLLGDTRRIFVAPDSSLCLVPFGALVDENGDYLIRHWSFAYLTTGRELPRLSGPHEPARGGSVVLADPDFGPMDPQPPSGAARAGGDQGGVLTGFARASFPPLPATRREGRAAAAALGATLLTGPAATDGAIAALHGPRVLHVASHGFMVGDAPAPPAPMARGVALHTDPTPNTGIDALFRSGIVLAGANLHRPEDDGILTAAEVAWLDLAGTELVVLSACKTATGATGAGSGVYGLQQSLIAAGARSIVMSLWDVDDPATSDLMTGFYAGLARGRPRSDALRDAQLAILADSARAHPFYWASFIHYGDGSPLPVPVHGPGK